MSNDVRDNTERNRLELAIDGRIAFSEYEQSRNQITFCIRTEVPKELSDCGYGSALCVERSTSRVLRSSKSSPAAPFVQVLSRPASRIWRFARLASA